MNKKKFTRRDFLGKAAIGAAGIPLANMSVNSMSTVSYKRIIGANDRINIGFLGCGARGKGHQKMVKMSVSDKNIGVVAVCISGRATGKKLQPDVKKCLGIVYRSLNIQKICWK